MTSRYPLNTRLSAVAIAALLVACHISAADAAPAANALPTGGVITYGNATITQSGNTLNINQGSGSAISSFTTFSIGANAVVNINQPGAASSFLARVTGSDPSQIYGLLKSNGTVALINQNGILVGPSGVVDVSRFIASTLNISDSDFLAGRLSFSAGSTAGDVVNQGVIKTSSGGSVYLVGSNVSNAGVITSANGEVLLAAGQTVQLVDTGTPGVTVDVTGTSGNVTNLGNIVAQAGTIGAAAGLISNSGVIDASSVVNDGGRIFLRASQNLTTTAGSNVSADGAAQGGNVVLDADKIASFDGKISATGAAGRGGYIETSGKESLDVVNLPTVGTGGQWLIDPLSLEVVAGSSNNVTESGDVITSNGSGSTISASTITTLLNSGTSVTLATGADSGTTGGDITVSAAITKTGGAAASLTLNADGDININANITSTSNPLSLNLSTNVNGIESGTHTITVTNATIGLNGGTLTTSDGYASSGNGNMVLASNAVLDFTAGGTLSAGPLTLLSGSTVNADASATLSVMGTLTNGGTLNLSNSHLNAGTLLNTGTATLSNMTGSVSTLTNQGAMSLTSGTSLSGEVFANTGNLALDAGTELNVGSFTNGTGGTLSGNGTVSVESGYGTLVNNGTIAPGTDGTVGSLTINGSLTQSATGTLLIDIASATSYDQLNVSGTSISLDGTLQTHWLGGYVPALGTTYAAIVGSGSTTTSGVFHNVLGDAVDTASESQMIGPDYSGTSSGLLLAVIETPLPPTTPPTTPPAGTPSDGSTGTSSNTPSSAQASDLEPLTTAVDQATTAAQSATGTNSSTGTTAGTTSAMQTGIAPTTTTGSVEIMTVGGDPGTFGGGDTTADSTTGSSSTGSKSGAAKMYCN